MLRQITAIAVLLLCGCAAQQETYVRQREAEAAAPDLDFKGPLRPATISKAQVKLVQQGITPLLKEPKSATFGESYRGGLGPGHVAHRSRCCVPRCLWSLDGGYQG